VAEFNQAEAQFYDLTCQLLQIHESLLKDSLRNRTFYAALAASVTSSSRVLDIGSGTGIWAIKAAQLGAARVVAVEREPLMAGMIQALALENGVADRVEVLQADVGEIRLEKEFDLVISETIGHLIFDEQIVDIMIDARKRFLKPDGAVIPRAASLVVAPVYLAPAHGTLPVDIEADFDYFESMLLNVPVALTGKTRLEILGEPQELVNVDLAIVERLPNLVNLKAVWADFEVRRVNGFAVWAEARLSDEIQLSTMDTTSWSTTVYPIRPFQKLFGRLELDLTLTNITNYWTATLVTEAGREEQSYSPALAGTELLARSRVPAETFGHLKRLGLLGSALRI